MAAPAAQDVPVPTDGADPWDDRDPWQPALDSQQGSEDEEAFSPGAGDGLTARQAEPRDGLSPRRYFPRPPPRQGVRQHAPRAFWYRGS